MEQEQGERRKKRRDDYCHSLLRVYNHDAVAEDEIDLLNLWRVLVQQWRVTLTIIILSVLVALAYVFLATPVYEAQAIIRQPDIKSIEALNIPDISMITSADIFTSYIKNLKSNSLRQQFFDENPQFNPLRQQFADQDIQFVRDNLPRIKEGTKNEAGYVFISLQGYDAKIMADWLNSFISFIEKTTINDFIAGVETRTSNRKKELESQLQVRQNFAYQRRLDRILLLEEQIAIAQKLKIFERKIIGNIQGDQGYGLTVNTMQEPMYLRGVKELTIEKEALEKRKNDESFIEGFRDKQEILAQLVEGVRQLRMTRSIARAVTIDQPAVETQQPVKPRRMLVLALSVVLGGMVGIFASFMINLVQERKVNRGDALTSSYP